MVEWRPVTPYPDRYEVSDTGLIRRSAPGKGTYVGRILRPHVHPDNGYLTVYLGVGTDQHRFYVHRLVLEAFVGPCPEGMEGCHWDRTPSNNALSNLRWDTTGNNHLDKVRHGTHNNAIKTHCPRQHPLEEPNLVPSLLKKNGGRTCLACSRARADVRVNPDKHLQIESDRQYNKILEAFLA